MITRSMEKVFVEFYCVDMLRKYYKFETQVVVLFW